MAKLSLNPVKVHLKELPLEGRRFEFSRESGEFNEALKDLIGTSPYSIDLQIKPLGNVFELRGQVLAKMPLECSRCAFDFDHEIKENLNEVLVIAEALPRSGHMSKVNHANELQVDGPQCTVLESDFFNMADFVHEIIALAEPIKPLGKPNCDESCENFIEFLASAQAKGISLGATTEKESPFSVLKNLKIPN